MACSISVLQNDNTSKYILKFPQNDKQLKN